MTAVKDWTSRNPQEAAEFHALHFVDTDLGPVAADYENYPEPEEGDTDSHESIET